MRTEMKIALLLFAFNTTTGYLFSFPEFIRGSLFGLYLFFMIIGLIPEKSYEVLKTRQKRKLKLIKGIVGMNNNAR